MNANSKELNLHVIFFSLTQIKKYQSDAERTFCPGYSHSYYPEQQTQGHCRSTHRTLRLVTNSHTDPVSPPGCSCTHKHCQSAHKTQLKLACGFKKTWAKVWICDADEPPSAVQCCDLLSCCWSARSLHLTDTLSAGGWHKQWQHPLKKITLFAKKWRRNTLFLQQLLG